MSHHTVFLHEAVTALCIKPKGIYIDATFGRGGHTRLMLSQLDQEGRLIICDQDLTAIALAQHEFGADARVSILHTNFSHLEKHLVALQLWGKIDGILFDLGISSPQVDQAARGFSFLKQGPLDMRMNQSQGLPLREKLQQIDAKTLSQILWNYGEEKFALKISIAIKDAMTHQAEELDTKKLAEMIANTIPKKFHDLHKHPATRSFQALRIWVNDEMKALETVLKFFPTILAPQGVAVFISFHSLEDRQVKTTMQELSHPPIHARGLPISQEQEGVASMHITVKMQKPDLAAVRENPRSRSAVLRAFMRTAAAKI